MMLPKPPHPAPPVPRGTGRTQAWSPEIQQLPGAAEKQVLALAARVAEMEEALLIPSEVVSGARAIVNFMANGSPDDNWSVYGLGPVHHRDARIAEQQKEIERLTTCLQLAEALLNRERENRK